MTGRRGGIESTLLTATTATTTAGASIARALAIGIVALVAATVLTLLMIEVHVRSDFGWWIIGCGWTEMNMNTVVHMDRQLSRSFLMAISIDD